VQSAVLRSHVVCLSVRPSVCNVGDCDHFGWNSSEIISPLVSLGCSLCADPNIGFTPRGTPGNFGPKWSTPLPPVDLSAGDIWSQIAAHGYRQHNGHNGQPRKPTSLFRMVPRWPPTTPSPKWGFRMPLRYANGHIPAMGDPIHFMFVLG